MVIAIDASRSVETIQKTGVEKVSDELLLEIKNQKSKIKNNDFDIIYYTPVLISWLPKENQKILNWPFKYLWTQIRLAWEILFHPPDVLFFPVHIMPLALIIPSLLSFPRKRESRKNKKDFWIPDQVGDDKKKTKYYKIIHDIAFKKRPQDYSFWQRMYLNLDLWLAIKLCRKIFVPTQAVKDDILHFCHSVPQCENIESGNKIIVVLWGYKPICHSERSEESLANASSIFHKHGNLPYPSGQNALLSLSMTKRKKQILYIGRVEEKKNITNLIKAFEIFLERNPDYKLVLAGAIDKDFITRYTLPVTHYKNIEFLGYVSDEKKYELLHESSCLVLVSKEEGFGFPILEAFDFGLPVLASDIPVLREVGGNACLYVNPDSVEEISDGLERITSDSDEELTEELVKKGRERLKDFSWEKAGREVMKVMVEGGLEKLEIRN